MSEPLQEEFYEFFLVVKRPDDLQVSIVQKEAKMNIEVKKPTQEELATLGVASWPIWEKEASSFDWHYDQKEVCYFLQGEVEVEVGSGEKVKIAKGDLATFPEGLSCKWHVRQAVKKHYNFG